MRCACPPGPHPHLPPSCRSVSPLQNGFSSLHRQIVERRNAGGAIAQVAASLLLEDPPYRFPLVLQEEGHSRLIVGVLPADAPLQSADGAQTWHVLICDPHWKHGKAVVECVRASELNGSEYQLVTVSGRRLSEAEALRRKGDPQPAAIWNSTHRGGEWIYSDFWKIRFDCST